MESGVSPARFLRRQTQATTTTTTTTPTCVHTTSLSLRALDPPPGSADPCPSLSPFSVAGLCPTSSSCAPLSTPPTISRGNCTSAQSHLPSQREDLSSSRVLASSRRPNEPVSPSSIIANTLHRRVTSANTAAPLLSLYLDSSSAFVFRPYRVRTSMPSLPWTS